MSGFRLDAYPIVLRDVSTGDRFGGVENVVLESNHYVPDEPISDTAIVFMHPVGGLTYLPFLRKLARAGIHVISCANRYRGNDSALIVERVLIDLGACIRHARERLGFERIVIGGWSGGGSLSLYYQQQAEHPTVTAAPSGLPIDVAGAGLVPADAVLLIATHTGRQLTLTEFLDPAIVDESDPYTRDPELDLYGPDPAHSAPYDPEFLARYAEAQVARNRRITAWVREELDRGPGVERGFTVHGTMAAPKWLDPTIDPNDRKPRWCFMGDPERANSAPAGLARFSSLHSWLSQWSYDDARANGPAVAADISVPVLVITNSADDACTPAHSEALVQAFRPDQVEHHTVPGATHYYIGDQTEQMDEATATVTAWLDRLGFA